MEATLVLNAGSSSVKFRLYGKETFDGIVDRIGGDAILELYGKTKQVPVNSAKEAGLLILSILPEQPVRIVHRVVHGGKYAAPQLITPKLVRELKKLIPLAPLHLPPALALIALFGDRTGARQIACFDTMFHRSMPAVAKTYAIPQQLAKKYHIERYGFHGIAHGALLREGARLMGASARSLRVISCQLGNGASVCAIKNGKSIDTSMGFTPLQGLVMGTRSGSIDPAIIEFLCTHEHMTVEEVTSLLENESGLRALAGTNDVRDILALERKGDRRAHLALDIFAYHVRKWIGSYMVALGGVDLIVLGGGVMRAPSMRKRIFSGLEEFGIVLGKQQGSLPLCITSGRVQVWAVEVDEQKELLRLSRGL